MPGAAGEPYRLVVDHGSLDFRGRSGAALTDLLDDFSDMLEDLQAEHEVAAWASWVEQECRDHEPLHAFLYQRDSGPESVSPDAKRRLSRLMDRCRLWDDDEAAATPDGVSVAGTAHPWPSAAGHALRRSLQGTTTACLLLPTKEAVSGWQPVTSDSGASTVFFVTNSSGIPSFWRALFDREDIGEADFGMLAGRAFPALVLASSLSFSKFQGHYRDLLPWVVKALSVTNDHFAAALATGAGIPRQVQAALGGHGITLSPESPKTHANEAAMRERDVEHEGEVYRCEWHVKQHPTHNRVHFSLPDQRLGGRILIGIFTDHLPT
ncbi:hypothetical protein [Actinacidiphila sp. bgisy144]|uniref:hypothetical protein n=1 Tax=Actinacidiphila sp. bgisy144 TaxID=3413791 RepID=UPI003EBBBCE4